MSSTLSAQRAAILSLLDIVEGKVSKPKPDAIALLRARAYDACETLDWCETNRALIVKAKQMKESGE